MRKFFSLILALCMATLAWSQEPATFEDVTLGGNGLWVAPEEGENELPSGGWIFTNYNYTSWGYWVFYLDCFVPRNDLKRLSDAIPKEMEV